MGHKALWGDFFLFFSSSYREYYNDLQRHVESKLCCKCLSHGPAKNHKEKMQKVWNSQQRRLTRKYGFVFLWVKVTFMLCFPMRNYKLSKEFWSLACTYKSNLSGTAPVKTILRLKAVRTRADSLQTHYFLFVLGVSSCQNIYSDFEELQVGNMRIIRKCICAAHVAAIFECAHHLLNG